MVGHDALVGYPSNAAATAAAHAAQAECTRQVPYRVWQCAACQLWHAVPWNGHAHHPEIEPIAGDDSCR